MNELHTAYSIRNALDESTSRLTEAQASRLSQARARALSAMPAQAPARVHGFAQMQPDLARGARASRAGGRSRRAQDGPPWIMRLALTAAPLALVAVGALALLRWSDDQRLEALAELDKAVLLDDVPLAGYADAGFGVFLKHTDQ
ncbi:MAG: DUF3619 family protein [Burkholderiaceae bacterium]